MNETAKTITEQRRMLTQQYRSWTLVVSSAKKYLWHEQHEVCCYRIVISSLGYWLAFYHCETKQHKTIDWNYQ